MGIFFSCISLAFILLVFGACLVMALTSGLFSLLPRLLFFCTIFGLLLAFGLTGDFATLAPMLSRSLSKRGFFVTTDFGSGFFWTGCGGAAISLIGGGGGFTTVGT
ncbi:hypothetical protein BpHYR1_047510 [Brachionus plicatilis]|uniref:Uncharacterized protein n=1 Tax=Brachionus plicatilis TaxID=10195 RepID=A0A3M7PNN7_BRAPC|nr:hypothetical protein BpHYR1_047510 [Brachionus plicatilis]